ncbi:DUF6879 family protein [Streptomyces sp. NPDC002055]|uniref:DUF6879 family protein n=1 Tax=Streptomyces sp. NPDC002055 TaxID=3154534 RepID=UPI003319490F
MNSLIPFSEVSYLFDDFEHTAWRLESRAGYADDRQSDAYQNFLRGEPAEEDLTHPYYAARRRQAAEGKRFERVRIVDTPATEGQLYLLHRAQFNVSAGEDIRNLHRSDAVRLDLPDADFWLFDSRTLVTFHFDAEDHILGVQVSQDPDEVVRACQIRDAAWHYAIRHTQFTAQILPVREH